MSAKESSDRNVQYAARDAAARIRGDTWPVAVMHRIGFIIKPKDPEPRHEAAVVVNDICQCAF